MNVVICSGNNITFEKKKSQVRVTTFTNIINIKNYNTPIY